MRHGKWMIPVLVGALLLSGGIALAQDQERAQDRTQFQAQEQDQERIYGSQLMTPEERAEYRNRLRAATTAEERERIRMEHHEQMQQRAAARGMTLPEEPPVGGRGMGPGGGGMMGPGYGGMGPGGGGRGR